ncbi:type I-U CRISPR-associated RAMP protein Csb1/Cas7u [Thiocapsa sp.]|uniref:type I-G CRISPR-associated RAMP protein Csb1/Cas7g n=1 Tax=Thiocapsa sp. TaxID=2024551 RepID=UPI003593423A
MAIDLAALNNSHRLLFAISLKPLLGHRFQPTGFPGLGASTFRTSEGDSLLVESAQSMANRLEMMVWDEAEQDVKQALRGLSHVRIERSDSSFLTDTILESHRLNSPYLLAESSKKFLVMLKEALGVSTAGPIDRRKLARVLLNFDVGCLLHGVFLARPELAGGRLRVARSLSAFIEADGVEIAASGGVKNDHVNPQGDTKVGFGNVPFARDEFTADRLTLYVNLDLAQIRGFGLDEAAQRLLILLALYKLRALLDAGPRLRTACDLAVASEHVAAINPVNFLLPTMAEIEPELKEAIAACSPLMEVRKAIYGDEIVPKRDAQTEAETED